MLHWAKGPWPEGQSQSHSLNQLKIQLNHVPAIDRATKTQYPCQAYRKSYYADEVFFLKKFIFDINVSKLSKNINKN
jgi:hypothetical protein